MLETVMIIVLKVHRCECLLGILCPKLHWRTFSKDRIYQAWDMQGDVDWQEQCWDVTAFANL